MRPSFSRIFAAKSPYRLIGYFLRRFSGLAVAQAITAAAITLLSFAVPEASSRILGTYIPEKDYLGAVLWLATALVAVALLQCLQLLQQRLASSVTASLTSVLQRYTLRRCLSLPMQWHLLNGPAAATRSFFYDISNLSGLASNLIGMAVFPVAQIALVFGVMLYLNHTLALISLIPLATMAAASWRSVKVLPLAAAAQIREGNMLGSVFFDFVSCVRLVKALCIEPAAAREVRPQIESASAASRKLSNLNALFSTFSSLAVSVGGLLVLGAGLFLLARQQLGLTDLLRFIFFAALLYQPFERLSHFGQIYLQARESWSNMCSNLSGARPEKYWRQPRASFPHSTDIVAENISFAYGGRAILKCVTVTAKEGEVVGIMGRSGGGKTTLLSILSGYLTPHEGSVGLGGTNLEDLSRAAIRENVFYAGQDAMLFNRSIRFNLLMARANATEDMMWEVLDHAGLREAVASFPERLDHIVGDHGGMLSGGERQRLLIAMAWLRNPRILLLDEITAALDAITDRQIRASIGRLMEGRTTIIVSHRLENLVRADKIYVLEGGQILAEGSHPSLLSSCSLYQQLWEARSF